MAKKRRTKAEIQKERELAMWVTKQKLAYANGTLGLQKVKKLEEIPGWTWTIRDKELKAYLAELAKMDAPPPAPPSFEGLALERFTGTKYDKETGTYLPRYGNEP